MSDPTFSDIDFKKIYGFGLGSLKNPQGQNAHQTEFQKSGTWNVLKENDSTRVFF